MSNGREFDKPGVYQVRIGGTLNERWSDWFGDFTIVPQADGETLLTGPVTDQLALHGILSTIRDLGLPLLSVQQVEASDDAGDRGD
jgi:hypothetical protein